MNKILLIIIAAFLLPGCGLVTGPMSAMLVDSGPDFVDVSASESVATIRGQSHYGPFWTVSCWIEKPAKAKKLKIDAGLVYITAMCNIEADGCCPDESAAFSFTAIAGHEYRVRRRMRPDAVIELVDDTDDVVINIDKAVKKDGRNESGQFREKQPLGLSEKKGSEPATPEQPLLAESRPSNSTVCEELSDRFR